MQSSNLKIIFVSSSSTLHRRKYGEILHRSASRSFPDQLDSIDTKKLIEIDLIHSTSDFMQSAISSINSLHLYCNNSLWFSFKTFKQSSPTRILS